ncbi:MAG: DNA-formamidopyrimidine glycosylase [Candidatus Acidiferrales bacterium]
MPELPEVEAVARALRPLVEGRVIRRCRVIHSIAVRPSSGRGAKQAAAAMERAVRGQKIRSVKRRGKYLILRLESCALVMHFRLDGQLVWFDSRKTSGHIDVALETDDGTLGFVDRRHFGRVLFVESPGAISGIEKMGIEPLARDFTAVRFGELLRASSRPLKLFLLDQNKIAGIGNIYSSEAMWRARINPRRRANRLNAVETRRLHKAIVDVLHRALECCSNPAPNFRDPQWWFQGLESILRVYGREGKNCRACRQLVKRIEQGGRSTFFCARCQR